MKGWFFGAAAALAANPAWARTCVVGEHWDGVQIPWSVGVVEFFITPLGLAVICLACVAVILGRVGLLALAAAFSFAVAAYVPIAAGAAGRAMGAEGCAPSPLAATAVLLLVAAALAGLAFLRRRMLLARSV